MSEIRLTLRIIEFGGGGFLIAHEVEGEDVIEWEPMQAVSSLDEAAGVVQRRMREWNLENVAYRKAQSGPSVIRPQRFWPQLFGRVDAVEETGT